MIDRIDVGCTYWWRDQGKILEAVACDVVFQQCRMMAVCRVTGATHLIAIPPEELYVLISDARAKAIENSEKILRALKAQTALVQSQLQDLQAGA